MGTKQFCSRFCGSWNDLLWVKVRFGVDDFKIMYLNEQNNLQVKKKRKKEKEKPRYRFHVICLVLNMWIVDGNTFQKIVNENGLKTLESPKPKT